MQHNKYISITSDAHEDGTFVSGGSLAAFNGFWYADETFSIPAGASDAVLSFSGLNGDDRVILELNGIILGDFFLQSAHTDPPGMGPGDMAFPPGLPDVSYTFTGITSGTDSADLNIGGINDLRLIVNNTHDKTLTSSTETFQGNGDATNATVVATVSYELVPEPTTLGIAVAILCASNSARRRRKTSIIHS